MGWCCRRSSSSCTSTALVRKNCENVKNVIGLLQILYTARSSQRVCVGAVKLQSPGFNWSDQLAYRIDFWLSNYPSSKTFFLLMITGILIAIGALTYMPVDEVRAPGLAGHCAAADCVLPHCRAERRLSDCRAVDELVLRRGPGDARGPRRFPWSDRRLRDHDWRATAAHRTAHRTAPRRAAHRTTPHRCLST